MNTFDVPGHEGQKCAYLMRSFIFTLEALMRPEGSHQSGPDIQAEAFNSGVVQKQAFFSKSAHLRLQLQVQQVPAASHIPVGTN